MIIAQTERLILRQFELNDAEFLFHLNSNPEVINYTGDPPFDSVTEARNFIANYKEYEKNGFGRWICVLKSSNRAIGWCGLKKHDEGYVDLGFRFLQEYWGRGFATESALGCVQYAFSKIGLTEIIGRASLQNEASIRVLKKIGMSFLKNAPCEGIEDSVYFSVSKNL